MWYNKTEVYFTWQKRTQKNIKKKRLLSTPEGRKDGEISEELGISKECVSAWLNGKRTVNHKPVRVELPNGNCVCSVCGEEKKSTLFPSPRSNGKSPTLSKISYCKECLAEKSFKIRKGNVEAYLRNRVYCLKCRCLRENIPFGLSSTYLISLYNQTQGRCFYTDEQMIIVGKKDSVYLRQSISIDRVVPEKGYIDQNVVLCTYKANAVKQNLSVDELYMWIPGWYWRLVDSGRIKQEGEKCRSRTF